MGEGKNFKKCDHCNRIARFLTTSNFYNSDGETYRVHHSAVCKIHLYTEQHTYHLNKIDNYDHQIWREKQKPKTQNPNPKPKTQMQLLEEK
ncbi:MAG: hypothetical protein IPM51_11785 [Sphingobacteriaceae bacterium]|nr:hypothetical protein [Sphingobacteriaceae bacterium]